MNDDRSIAAAALITLASLGSLGLILIDAYQPGKIDLGCMLLLLVGFAWLNADSRTTMTRKLKDEHDRMVAWYNAYHSLRRQMEQR